MAGEGCACLLINNKDTFTLSKYRRWKKLNVHLWMGQIGFGWLLAGSWSMGAKSWWSGMATIRLLLSRQRRRVWGEPARGSCEGRCWGNGLEAWGRKEWLTFYCLMKCDPNCGITSNSKNMMAFRTTRNGRRFRSWTTKQCKCIPESLRKSFWIFLCMQKIMWHTNLNFDGSEQVLNRESWASS